MAHPGGRPSKRTKKLTQKIANAIGRGLTNQQAADLARIDLATFYRWQQEPDFVEEIAWAKAARTLKRIEKVDTGVNFYGAAWALERLSSEDQSNRRFQRPEIQFQVNQQFNVNTTGKGLGRGAQENYFMTEAFEGLPVPSEVPALEDEAEVIEIEPTLSLEEQQKREQEYLSRCVREEFAPATPALPAAPTGEPQNRYMSTIRLPSQSGERRQEEPMTANYYTKRLTVGTPSKNDTSHSYLDMSRD